ncbi:kinetochore Sim4 complex subunit FTA2-domain-containing protein [Nemania sp. FL0916]|nr:kinetochore Sim4 complex subunit FTA2-domain-containing protein [Nemania sp. FL0916]
MGGCTLDPLPRSIKGSKLKAFDGNIESVQFQKLLSSGDNEQSSDGQVPHSQVFLVSIDGKQFALKIFNFFSIDEIRPFAFGRERVLDDNIVRHHLDPFYAECRAFGLLVEKGRDDELAVRCHGYAFLSDTLEHQIERQFGIKGWNRQPEDEGTQLRAIVKDYIKWTSLCHRRSFETMRKNIQELNALGIYNMDIREGNYLGGRLFDFSIAITSPHLRLWTKFQPIDIILRDKKDDLRCFDSMVRGMETGVDRNGEPATAEEPVRRPVTRSQKSKALEAGI